MIDDTDRSIPARLLRVAAAHPDQEAVVDGEIRITYARLATAIVQATRSALAAGILPGDRAAILAPNGYRWILAALGILGARGVVVPVNTRFKGAEAADVLARSGARILFTDNDFLGIDFAQLLAEHTAALPEPIRVVVMNGPAREDVPWHRYLGDGRLVAESAATARIASVGPDDPCDILFTSGTTGRPKGAVSTHGRLLRLYDDWSDIVGLRSGGRQLVITPFFHSFGYKAGWLATLLRGATVVPMAVFDVDTVLATVERERITLLPGPPTLLQDLLDSPDRDRYDLTSLRATVIGAATIPVDLIRRLRDEMTFTTVLSGYGLTETNGPASLCRADDDLDTIAHTAGKAMPGTEIRIVDGNGTELPPGAHGEIVIRGYHLMTGYLDDPVATAAAIDGAGWLHTGDLGRLDERGYLMITGRMKEMFVVGGFNVYPAEVEELLLGHEALARVAVVGLPDTRLGEVGMAFVVPRPGATVTADELITWARARMANYKAPRYVEICPALPTNALGKIRKDELLARGLSRADAAHRR
ncbi:FadD3 family acyl-CoA ligase [Nocardia sp. alder85J]|uniref:FadD3 family acyl-CoA ligase n=1 Tax=Nocardia sp. alder85J TaxID=2862949 RepID=UPI001CD564B3|nr:FadD3 family acyl-CoA ligase [Nocardia sp. alder85J]MCX4099013.1 FadD3 family acyl-CoA ligase [Nocardia sp. alder85J]